MASGLHRSGGASRSPRASQDERGLRIRRSVLVVEPTVPGDAAATVVTSSDAIHHILGGAETLKAATANGEITIEGDPSRLHEFFGYLDPQPTEPVRISVR